MSPPSLTSPGGNAPTQQHTHPLLPGQPNNVNLLNKGRSSQKKKKKKGDIHKGILPYSGKHHPIPRIHPNKIKEDERIQNEG
ncbi:hypothetical protein TNCV_579091 [Trichonephila clavipes]|nr:hypothetical protein TNCV_579091 [Trichonephila clavipes]